MKKIYTILICLIVGVSFLCCAGLLLHRHFPKRTTVQFASWGSESEISILKPILAEFEKENPDIKVEFFHIPQNYFQKIHLLFVSNTAPDVVFMNNHYLPIYANAQVLEDLTLYRDEFEYNQMYQKAIEALSWEGKNYAVPRDVSTLVLFYNKDIFNKYHIPYPNGNQTLDDFLTIAQNLTHYPDLFGISFDEEPVMYLPYLTAFGADNFSNYDDEKLLKGIEFYADLRSQYHVAPYREEVGSATMAQMFLQGKLAMHLSGRWLVPKYRDEAKFDWDVAPFPKGAAGRVVPLDASGWAITKSSKHKKEAVRLVKYLSSKQSSEKFTQSGLIVPARFDTANSKYFLDGQKPKNAKVFLDVIETAKPTPVTLDFKKVLDDLRVETEFIFNQT